MTAVVLQYCVNLLSAERGASVVHAQAPDDIHRDHNVSPRQRRDELRSERVFRKFRNFG